MSTPPNTPEAQPQKKPQEPFDLESEDWDVEEAYIKIFQCVHRGYCNDLYTKPRVHELANELVSDGLLVNWKRQRAPSVWEVGWRITFSGRKEWARLVRERRERVWWRRCWAKGLHLLGYLLASFLGALGSKILDWLDPLFS